MDSFNDKVWLEVIKTLLSISVLLLTWLLGQNILGYWERRKRRKETDRDLANQFQHLYAEFKTITRLWKVQTVYMVKDLGDPKEKQWDLLSRATDAEGKIEAILMTLSMERWLDSSECETLGYFRQTYQQLRESIRQSKYMEVKYDDALYRLFHDLSVDVSHLISNRKNRKRMTITKSKENLQNIMEVRSIHWEMKLGTYEKLARESEDTDDRSR